MRNQIQQGLVSLAIVILAVGWALIGSGTWGLYTWFQGLGVWVFLVHLVVFIPSFWLKSEKLYDLTGSFCFISSTAALVWWHQGELYTRSLLLATMVIVWSARLGWYLGKRVFTVGKDRRFDQIKLDGMTYLMTWLLSALWVYVTAGCAWAAILQKEPVSMQTFGWLCVWVWLGAWVVEVVADAQKSQFRMRNKGKKGFIQTGLWSISRHPNYAGEIVMWFAVAGLAAPALQGWQKFLLLSPCLVYVLIRYVSGVPMLESQADKTFGHRKDYQHYKETVPILWPRLLP